ncbi:glycoside hydrolase family 92 protein [Flavobacterium sp. F-380]|uniref:Glycoside hydrolase family 92 protein n=1 Tax=Flavobacterium kayseriense TaxID=2764714 RepID=A0ABR7JA67_9FLAO|nr:glycoside hydrolase domain-containing protein [Flavobacterium kayseriense]MBC5842214.1 glycoside hydrolase family 92 protein [Flavobacterium kayseriense]MBC5848744.1 glycoside hydrolase family 92 protein [Flavobacterium kayseriense]
MKNSVFLSVLFLLINSMSSYSQDSKNDITSYTDKVNVFLGTSGDHGQMSPAASSPFNMMSIGPQTYPHIHAGYEYLAKEFIGFTHTRIEGVGCLGSGGNLLVKPIVNSKQNTKLLKKTEKASPGLYAVSFENGIEAKIQVEHNFGIHEYLFPQGQAGLYIDLSYAFVNRFVAEEHEVLGNTISGWVETKTTCDKGIYRIYYAIEISNAASINAIDTHKLLVEGAKEAKEMRLRIGFSSVSTVYAKERIKTVSSSVLANQTKAEWNTLLGKIKVEGEKDREDLFYSLLYRALQAPFLISEKDGTYAAIDGSIQRSRDSIYNGWAIWDNYREQLPLLSLAYPEKYGAITKSISNLYVYGKNNWATKHEPSPTVRTEHAMVVLLDAYNKGYKVDFNTIKDSLIAEGNRLEYNSADKALESSYDNWALSEILKITKDVQLSEDYLQKAVEYKSYWKKDFADLSKEDVDKMPARGMYQGTVWQYRWFVPFDLKGLKNLIGSEDKFVAQLDQFFDEDNYNHANQPDLQVPGLYNASRQPWKSQKLFRELLLDTVVQSYFNDNSKGIDSYIGRIYKNQPQAYVRTMDDDAGTMSSWFVLRSIGLSAANVGDSIYYLTAPIFKKVTLQLAKKNTFTIEVKNYNKDHFYVEAVWLNNKKINRNWLSHQEIMAGGLLLIETSAEPNTSWGTTDQWISEIKP